MRRGHARRQARPVRAVRRLLALPGLRLHQEGGPAAARAAAVRGRSAPRTATATSSPRRARRTGNVFWGCSQLPEVRLHDELRAGRRRSTTPTTARWRRKGEAAHLPEVRRRRSTLRRTAIVPGERSPGGPPNPEALARPARGGAARRRAAAPRRRPRAADGRRARRDRTRRRPTEPAAGRVSAARATCDPPGARAVPPLASRPATPRRTRPALVRDGGRGVPRLARRARRRLARARRAPTCAPTSPSSATRGARSSTVAQRLAAIRSFHRFAAREGLAPGDPWGAIATPRLPRRLPRVLEVDQVERLLAVVDDGAGRRRRGRAGADRAGHRARAARPGPRRDRLRGRACGSASWPPRTSARSTCGAARSGSSARAARSASGCSAGRRVAALERVPRGRPPGPRSSARAAAAGDATPDRGLPEPPRRAARRPRPALPARPPVPRGGPARRASRRTRCATRSPPTCSTAARTCASSRSCSATRASRRPRSTRTSRRRASGPRTATPTRGRAAGGPRPRRDATATRAPSPGPGSIVSGAFLVSRVLGWVRVVVIGNTFGAGRELDAFFAAFRHPGPDLPARRRRGAVVGAHPDRRGPARRRDERRRAPGASCRRSRT